MYEQIFQLKRQPFSVSPKTEHYFPSQALQTALAGSKMAIDRGNGPAVCFGAAGLGKTLLLEMLAEDYSEQFCIARIPCSQLSARIDLLQSILFALEQPYRDMSESELRLVLTDFVRPHEACPNGILILIDDAHWLNPGLLDELRLVSGITHQGEYRCHLVMTGNRRFEEALADPVNDSLNQRIGARSVLTPLSASETTEYIRIHLRRAGGGNRQFFSDGVLKQIHALTQGVPRAINQLCDNALVVCAVNGMAMVDEAVLNQAWQEIERFPAFWRSDLSPHVTESDNTSNADNDDWSVVEFGSLSPSDSTDSLDCDDSDEQPLSANSGIASDDHAAVSHPATETVVAEPREPTASGRDASHADEQSEASSTPSGAGHSLSAAASRAHADAPADIESTSVTQSVETAQRDSEPTADAPQPISAPNVPTPTRRSANPFEETFEAEEVVAERVRLVSTRHNQAAIQLTCAEVWSSDTFESKRPPYQFGTSLFASNDAFSGLELGDHPVLPSFQLDGLDPRTEFIDDGHRDGNSSTQAAQQQEPIKPSLAPSPHNGPAEDDEHPTILMPFEAMAKVSTQQASLNLESEPESDDDRDLFVLTDATRLSQQMGEAAAEAQNQADQGTPDSEQDRGESTKGKALVMDYEQLFNQLRKART